MIAQVTEIETQHNQTHQFTARVKVVVTHRTLRTEPPQSVMARFGLALMFASAYGDLENREAAALVGTDAAWKALLALIGVISEGGPAQ